MRVALALVLLSAMPVVQAAAPMPMQSRPQPQSTAAADAALLTFLDAAYDQQLDLSPESLTQLGLKTHYDRLDDYTENIFVTFEHGTLVLETDGNSTKVFDADGTLVLWKK